MGSVHSLVFFLWKSLSPLFLPGQRRGRSNVSGNVQATKRGQGEGGRGRGGGEEKRRRRVEEKRGEERKS